MVEQVTVGVDIGCRRHRVAIAAPDGRIAEEFDMEHGKEGFEKFFGRLSHYRESYQVPVSWRWRASTATPVPGPAGA